MRQPEACAASSMRTPQITPFTNTHSGCMRGATAKNCSKFVPTTKCASSAACV